MDSGDLIGGVIGGALAALLLLVELKLAERRAARDELVDAGAALLGHAIAAHMAVKVTRAIEEKRFSLGAQATAATAVAEHTAHVIRHGDRFRYIGDGPAQEAGYALRDVAFEMIASLESDRPLPEDIEDRPNAAIEGLHDQMDAITVPRRWWQIRRGATRSRS